MKRFTLVITFLTIIVTQSAHGQTLTFQGVLRDPIGRTVEDGNYALTVSIYDTVLAGDALWSEVHPAVSINHGVFVIELGSVNPLTLSFDRPYWLGVAINDAEEILPRFKLSTVPASLSVRGEENIFPYSGGVGVGTLEPTTDLVIAGEGDNYISVDAGGNEPAGYAMDEGDARQWDLSVSPSDNSLNIREADSARVFTVVGNGDVGIGITAPAAKLHIGGNAGQVSLKVDGNIKVPGDKGMGIGGNRYFGSDGSGNVGFRNNQNWGLNVDTGGKVGIGISAPSEALEISGDVKLSDGGSIIFNDGSSLSTALVGGSSNFLTNTADAVITADSDRDGEGSIQLLTRNETRAAVTDSGFGLGTDTPRTELDIMGDVNFSGGILKEGEPFVSSPWNSYGTDISTGAAARVGIGTSDPQYTLDVNGIVNVGGIGYPWGYLVNGNHPLTPLWEQRYYHDQWGDILFLYHYGTVAICDNVNTYNSYSNWINTWDFIVDTPGKMRINIQNEMDLTIYGNTTGATFTPEEGYNPLRGKGIHLGEGLDFTPVNWLYVYRIYKRVQGSYSDRRLKRNIRPVTNALAKVRRINGIKYDINLDTHPMFKDRELDKSEVVTDILGFSAQNLKEVVPEMVEMNEETGYYMIRNINQILPILVEALKELKQKNDELKERARKVRQALEELKER